MNKTNYMKAIIYISILINSITLLNAIPRGFVPMDESMQQMLDFYNTDTIIVVLPDQYLLKESDATTIESFVFWKQSPVHYYIHQSDLQLNDLGKHLQFFGPLNMFKPDSLFNIPFKAEENGFSFKGEVFNKPEDAFYYLHERGKRMFTCRNGENHPLAYVSFFASVYPLYVFSGNRIIYSGLDAREGIEEQINNMRVLSEDYFCQHISGRYFDLFFACPFSSVNLNLGEEMDAFATRLCGFLNQDTMKLKKAESYFYHQGEDLHYFLAAPQWQTIYGKSFGDINHILDFSIETFKHEAGHSIIGATIGGMPSAFFMEGFRQYTDYFFSREAYQNDLAVCKEKYELLATSLVYSANAVFFTDMAHYSIAGMFTGFIIEHVGLEDFIAAYGKDEIDELVVRKGFTMDGLMVNFQKHIKGDS